MIIALRTGLPDSSTVSHTTRRTLPSAMWEATGVRCCASAVSFGLERTRMVLGEINSFERKLQI